VAAVLDVADVHELLALLAAHLRLSAARDRLALRGAKLQVRVLGERILDVLVAATRAVPGLALVLAHVEELDLGQSTRVPGVGLDELHVLRAQARSTACAVPQPGPCFQA